MIPSIFLVTSYAHMIDDFIYQATLRYLYAQVSILWTFTLHSCAFIYYLCGSLINHVNQCEKKSLKEICHFTRFDNEESSYIWMISRFQDLWPPDRASNDVCSDVCTTKFCIISNLFYVSHVHVVERSIQPPPCRYFICRGSNLSLDRSKVGVSIFYIIEEYAIYGFDALFFRLLIFDEFVFLAWGGYKWRSSNC